MSFSYCLLLADCSLYFNVRVVFVTLSLSESPNLTPRKCACTFANIHVFIPTNQTGLKKAFGRSVLPLTSPKQTAAVYTYTKMQKGTLCTDEAALSEARSLTAQCNGSADEALFLSCVGGRTDVAVALVRAMGACELHGL